MVQLPTILLDERAAAAALGVTPRAMQEWRRSGGGPQYVQISSRCIRYRPQDLSAWAAERLRTSTPAGAARCESPTTDHAGS